ncbi:Retrovirus-related Pol polyprotein from transposon 17.6, partial [Mucuna pruriens]
MEKKGEQYAQSANKGKMGKVFEQGDLVWVHLRKERFHTLRKSKLLPQRDGPFTISCRINDNAYVLDMPQEYGGMDDMNLRTNSLQEGESNPGALDMSSILHLLYACERSCQELKERLTTSSVLILSNPNKIFKVYRNASHQALRCVLMQEKKVVSYASKQLKLHEKNYLTHDLESAMVVFAFKILRHYLYKAKFNIFSHHECLMYLFDQKELNMR